MARDRTYSTREIAQMWNVSESTVKRWADSFGLSCFRTPGGHRRFRLEDIYDFQKRRAFEATGLLSTEQWEDPNLEVWLNTRNFEKVRTLLIYLASQNQRTKVRFLLERLYLRGMRLEDIYDDVVAPNGDPACRASESGLSAGQALLVETNLEEALAQISQKMIHRKSNGRTALCASTDGSARIQVGSLARLLEIEGWDAFNLGDDVPLQVMSELVETEPINLVCLYAIQDPSEKACERLNRVTKNYRIPVIALSNGKGGTQFNNLQLEQHFEDLRTLRNYVLRLH